MPHRCSDSPMNSVTMLACPEHLFSSCERPATWDSSDNPVASWCANSAPREEKISRSALNDLFGVAFVAGMMRMNWINATTCGTSIRCPWLSDIKYYFMWKISIAPFAVTTSKSRPAAAVGRECVLCRSPSDTNGKWRPYPRQDTPYFLQTFIGSDSIVRRIVCPGWSGQSWMATMVSLASFSWSLLRTAYHQFAWAFFFFEIAHVHQYR